MDKSFYIIPTHNKEHMIGDVLNAVISCHNLSFGPLTIIVVVDGCTDNTENIALQFKSKHDGVLILYKPDVHEIECLNSGLKYIQDNLNPNPNDLIFMIQDDVILKEPNINVKFSKLFANRDNLGYISMRLGDSVFSVGGELQETNYAESEFGHWNQLNWNFHSNIRHNEFRECEIAIRSPTCTQWKRFKEHGFFDENLKPYGYDCHDFSIRMNKAGYTNGVYALEFYSDVKSGTMRSETPSKYNNLINQIYVRNKRYLSVKHEHYFLKKMVKL
jgi:glycosyltransferase involved in cell wall biosynthesis